ncbi:MAG: hypothetical protein ACP5RF_01905 [Candidatus Micrarchaeia archaeon]
MLKSSMVEKLGFMQKASMIIGIALVVLLLSQSAMAMPTGGGGGGGGSSGGSSVPQSVGYCPNQYSINSIAPWYCSQINLAVYNNFMSWEPILMLAVLVSFSIAAIIFMAGIAARSEKLRNFGVGEIYEASASLVFVVFFMLIAALIIGIIPGLYIGVDPYNTSLTFIYNTIMNTQGVIKAMYEPAMIAYFYSSITLAIDSAAVDIKIINYLSIALELLFIIPAAALSGMLIEGLMSLYLEFYLILFAMYAAIPVFLIPGVLLRSILPTRSVGGMLIGIAIGFYFVLPTLFSIAYFFTSKSTMQPFIEATAQLNNYGQGSGAITNGVIPNGQNSLPQALSNIKAAMGAFWISVLFYPALILTITYFIITTVAEFLGGMAHGGGVLSRI